MNVARKPCVAYSTQLGTGSKCNSYFANDILFKNPTIMSLLKTGRFLIIIIGSRSEHCKFSLGDSYLSTGWCARSTDTVIVIDRHLLIDQTPYFLCLPDELSTVKRNTKQVIRFAKNKTFDSGLSDFKSESIVHFTLQSHTEIIPRIPVETVLPFTNQNFVQHSDLIAL